MKKLWSIVLTLALLASLIACQPQAATPTWQEQYDLGVRYLSEGNYEEAIIAFTAAIEIDPKREDTYLKLAEAYTAQGNTDKAIEVLEQAIAAVGETEALTAALASFDYSNLINRYIPVIEAAIAETAYDFGTTGSGFLYDIDGDGIDELVMLNIYSEADEFDLPRHAYSIYDIENDEVIVKCNKEVLFYDAGGPSGYVGVVNYLGNTALLVYIDNGETGYQANRESVYTILDPEGLQTIVSTSLDYVSSDTLQVNNCTINGNTCSYNDYLAVVDAIEPIIIADIYSNDKSDGSMALYDLLRFAQSTSGITPNQPPQITKTDADQIANSVWDSYLKREQGFDWKIFEEESLIKDGIEYYCYTLQSNSEYGAADWSVFYYLFVNSVTGEYSNSLY